ncbi:MAG TPA: GlsB/YeaQ/YmgE family stress response membrane protein [Rudaea sp.]|nr:GlsB/YeaQ/YmgE family stress response membrane protein [Rudaea sp.]
MTLEAIIIFLIVGGIAGWLAGLVVRGRGLGIVGNIVVGIVGAFISGWLLPGLNLGLTGIIGSIIYAAIGAIILLVIIMLIRRT